MSRKTLEVAVLRADCTSVAILLGELHHRHRAKIGLANLV
jgi:hypothetical protein